MSLAGAGKSVVGLLDRKYVEDFPLEAPPRFSLVNASKLDTELSDSVSIFVYRVDIDPTRRHRTVEPRAPGEPVRNALSVELRFLLTVWMSDAERELEVLQNCMTILERNAILSGDLLAPGSGFEDGDSLKLTLETMSNEDMMRIWDAVAPSFRLSLPYCIRTVRIAPDTRPVVPLVETATRTFVPRATP